MNVQNKRNITKQAFSSFIGNSKNPNSKSIKKTLSNVGNSPKLPILFDSEEDDSETVSSFNSFVNKFKSYVNVYKIDKFPVIFEENQSSWTNHVNDSKPTLNKTKDVRCSSTINSANLVRISIEMDDSDTLSNILRKTMKHFHSSSTMHDQFNNNETIHEDYNQSNPKTTLINLACQFGSISCVSVLLQLGADINATDSNGITPLKMCCLHGQFDTAIFIIKHGANLSEIRDGF